MTYFPAPQRVGTQREQIAEAPSDSHVEPSALPVDVMTLDEAADRIAFQVCALAGQDHVSQTAERLIREMVLASIRLRGSARGAQQLSHFYATVLVAIAEQLNESEYLRDEWFIKWRDDCSPQ